jgi:hypothetical protein
LTANHDYVAAAPSREVGNSSSKACHGYLLSSARHRPAFGGDLAGAALLLPIIDRYATEAPIGVG